MTRSDCRANERGRGRGTPPLLVVLPEDQFYRHKLEWDDGANEYMTAVWRDNLERWKFWEEQAIAIHLKHHPRVPVPENPYSSDCRDFHSG